MNKTPKISKNTIQPGLSKFEILNLLITLTMKRIITRFQAPAIPKKINLSQNNSKDLQLLKSRHAHVDI